jgi:hypothetical protein
MNNKQHMMGGWLHRNLVVTRLPEFNLAIATQSNDRFQSGDRLSVPRSPGVLRRGHDE